MLINSQYSAANQALAVSNQMNHVPEVPQLHNQSGPQLTADQLKEVPKTEEEAFTQFVGETFYSIMVKQMRAGVGENSLFGDSTATRTYQQQFDTMMVQNLAKNDASQLSQAMYDLHKLQRAQ